MFWTAFVWGIGATVGGSLGLMLFVILFAAWDRMMRTPAAVRAGELAELTYAVLVERKELAEKQLTQLTDIAASMATMTQLASALTGEDNDNDRDYIKADASRGLGGFEG